MFLWPFIVLTYKYLDIDLTVNTNRQFCENVMKYFMFKRISYPHNIF